MTAEARPIAAWITIMLRIGITPGSITNIIAPAVRTIITIIERRLMLRLLTFLKARAPWAEGVVIGASVFLSGCVDHHDYYPTRHRTVTHHRDVVHDRGYYAPSYESGHGDGGHYEGSSDYED